MGGIDAAQPSGRSLREIGKELAMGAQISRAQRIQRQRHDQYTMHDLLLDPTWLSWGSGDMGGDSTS